MTTGRINQVCHAYVCVREERPSSGRRPHTHERRRGESERAQLARGRVLLPRGMRASLRQAYACQPTPPRRSSSHRHRPSPGPRRTQSPPTIGRGSVVCYTLTLLALSTVRDRPQAATPAVPRVRVPAQMTKCSLPARSDWSPPRRTNEAEGNDCTGGHIVTATTPPAAAGSRLPVCRRVRYKLDRECLPVDRFRVRHRPNTAGVPGVSSHV